MKIKSLKNYYVCVFPDGSPAIWTIAGYKKDCIAAFMQEFRESTWKDLQKRGFACIKVNITFEPVKK